MIISCATTVNSNKNDSSSAYSLIFKHLFKFDWPVIKITFFLGDAIFSAFQLSFVSFSTSYRISQYCWTCLKVINVHLYCCFYTLRNYSKKLAIEGILCGIVSPYLVASEQRKQTCCSDSSHTFVRASIPNPFDQWCCCNTFSSGTRPVQWGWSGNDMVVRLKNMCPCSWISSSILNLPKNFMCLVLL